MIKPRKLKFGPNIRINESVICATFGDLKSRDRELKLKKTYIENLLIRL